MIDTSTTLSSEIIYCKCGCGSIVKPGKIWIKNHNRRNVDYLSRPVKSNEKRSAWNKGVSPSEETRKRMSDSRKLQIRPPCSEETKLKMSKSLKGRTVWNVGISLTQETKDKISEKASGRPSPHKGKKMSQEFCDKLSVSLKGREPWNKGKTNCYTEDTRQRMRESCIERIEKMNDGKPIQANIGTLEKECLDLLQTISNQNIQRQYRIIGYFIDGYIPELNIAIEFDEKCCHSHGSVIERDIIRQLNIENKLNCIFFRIKENEWNLNKQQVIEKFQILIESITQHPIAVGE